MESNAQGHGAIKKAVISTLAISALGVTTGVSASETEVAVIEPSNSKPTMTHTLLRTK